MEITIKMPDGSVKVFVEKTVEEVVETITPATEVAPEAPIASVETVPEASTTEPVATVEVTQ